MGELSSKSEWYPECFAELRDKLQSSVDPVGQGLSKGLSVYLGANSEAKISGLIQAASKYRLAREFQSAKFSSYHDRTAMGYDSVFRVTFTVIAFESYGRMLGKPRWTDFDQELCPYFSSQSCALVREGFRKQQTSIVSALTDARLQNRLNNFFIGDDAQIIALAVAMRHAFAHGKLGATSQYSVKRDFLSSEIVNAIEKHCRNMVASIV